MISAYPHEFSTVRFLVKHHSILCRTASSEINNNTDMSSINIHLGTKFLSILFFINRSIDKTTANYQTNKESA